MKKFVCIILSVLVLFSVALMGGCSDFDFNPIGKWRLTDDIVYYADGTEMAHDTVDDLMFETYYIFEKSGTGYVLVCDDISDTRAIDFTYEYNSESVVITFANSNNSTETFVVSDDRTQMIDTTPMQYTDNNGNIVQSHEEIIITKT